MLVCSLWVVSVQICVEWLTNVGMLCNEGHRGKHVYQWWPDLVYVPYLSYGDIVFVSV